jgi:hypothetical protein
MNLKFEIGGFTIVELLVAMSLLVVLLGLSGMVFNTTIAAHRAGGASIDVSRNLRAITEQLNADFRGLRKNAPLFIKFYKTVDARYDMIHFFADGDFQTTKQYDSDGDGVVDKTIYGNIARICYGHANSVDIFNDATLTPDYRTYETLSRKTHILTADTDIKNVYGEIPLISNGGLFDYTQVSGSFGVTSYMTGTPPETYTAENALEFNTITLTEWLAALNFLNGGNPDNADAFVDHCMDDGTRPFVDLSAVETLHLLMTQGVVDFQIQWAYTADDLQTPGLFAGVRWWPSVDPAGDTSVASDFVTMTQDQFGVYFEMPGGTTNPDWTGIQNCVTGGFLFRQNFYPKALKFTFLLRDSNAVFADGKTFTHIVYIDN